MPRRPLSNLPAPKRYVPYKPRVSKPVKNYVNRQISRNQNHVWVQQATASATAAFDSPLVAGLLNSTNLFPGVGEKTEIEYMMCRWSALAQTTRPDHLRAIVFQWLKSDEGDSPVVGDILETASTEPSMRSGYELSGRENSVKFKILKDFYVSLNQSDSLEAGVSRFGKFKIKASSLQHKYGRCTGTNTGSGAIYILVISDVANASTPPEFAITACSKIRPENEIV